MDYSFFKKHQVKMMFIYVTLINIPIAQCTIPGTFFWKPRLGLDLAMPTTESSVEINWPSKDNIEKGLVTLVDGYQAGLSVISVAAGASSSSSDSQMDMKSSYFHTNMYRWALRYISLIPFWLGGNEENFCKTHQVWHRRFHFMDEFIPTWLKSVFFYVKAEDWKQEEIDYKRFKKYAEPAFGKHYRYPSKSFRDFKSQYTVETVDKGVSRSASV
ncbi:uncharacterized protein LOC118265681 [Spodoptera frugiperda]|uniref:Uncharacterized protein LOC118265681 n=2 Tax=Spodoptera frugiperda TaxID=7108 RepID=A0A9R0CZD0_SPOFR|nr:uncharacterized protein LOC118265681 [Spodoptera frugiperda]